MENIRLKSSQILHILSRLRHEVNLASTHYVKSKESLNSPNDPAYYFRILNDRLFQGFINLSEFYNELQLLTNTPNDLSELSSVKSQTLELIDTLQLPTEAFTASLLDETSLKLFNLVQTIVSLQKPLESFLFELAKEYSKKEMLKIRKALDFSSNEYLFHGTKLEYVKATLERGSILGYTAQRYWRDGKRRKEKDSDYEDSFWMKGISMTRDINYAISWADVTLIFDRRAILKQHEIQSYAWNFLFSSAHPKKEAEDFVVLNKTGRQFKKKDNPEFLKEYEEVMNDPKDDEEALEVKEFYKKEYEKFDSEAFTQPFGEFTFKDALKGFVIKGSTIDIFGLENETIQFLINHPLFMGIIENPNKPFA